jgi:hypothetical protein
MLLNRNALFSGGLRPHHYCLPVLKAERHREAVAAAATSGSAILPRHRQRAAQPAQQGIILRLRRHLLGAGWYRDLRRSLRIGRLPRAAGALCQRVRRRASTVCRSTRSIVLERREWQPAGGSYLAGDEEAGAVPCG